MSKSGWLYKKGGSRGNWRRRYFILAKNELSYYASPEMLKPLGTIYISNCRVEKDEANHKARNENVFIIAPPRAVGGRVFFLSAESPEEMQSWMQVLSKSAAAALDKSFSNPGELVIDSFGNKATRPLKDGFLEVQGKGLQGWKQRWVVCRKNVLMLYESKEQAGLHRPLGIIPLHGCKVEIIKARSKLIGNAAYRTVSRKVGLESRREWKWNVQHPTRRHWVLSAADQNIMEDWILACACAISSGTAPSAMKGSGADPQSFTTLVGEVAMAGEAAVAVQGRPFEKRFLVQVDNILYFCKDQKTIEPYHALDLENAVVKEERGGAGQFSILYMGNLNVLCDARTDQLRKEWMQSLERGVSIGQRENVLARRKLAGDDNLKISQKGVVMEVDDFSRDNSMVEKNEDYTTAVMDVDLYVAPARPPMKRTETATALKGGGASSSEPAATSDSPLTQDRFLTGVSGGSNGAGKSSSIEFLPMVGNDAEPADTEQILAMGEASVKETGAKNAQRFSNTTGEDFSVTSIMNILETERLKKDDPAPVKLEAAPMRVLRISQRTSGRELTPADNARLDHSSSQLAAEATSPRSATMSGISTVEPELPRKKTGWAAKPSATLVVRESKAVGKMRRPRPPPPGHMVSPRSAAAAAAAAPAYEDDDDDDVRYMTLQPLPNPPSYDSDDDERNETTLGDLPAPMETVEFSKASSRLSALLQDSVFEASATLSSCPKCGLARLKDHANFCDGCGYRFPASGQLAPPSRSPRAADDDVVDDASLDDSEKEFLAQQGVSEEVVREEITRASRAVGRVPYNARPVPGPPAATVAATAADRRDLLPAHTAPTKGVSSIPKLPSIDSDSDDDEDMRSLPPVTHDEEDPFADALPPTKPALGQSTKTIGASSSKLPVAAAKAEPAAPPPKKDRDEFDSFLDELADPPPRATAAKGAEPASNKQPQPKALSPRKPEPEEDPLVAFDLGLDSFNFDDDIPAKGSVTAAAKAKEEAKKREQQEAKERAEREAKEEARKRAELQEAKEREEKAARTKRELQEAKERAEREAKEEARRREQQDAREREERAAKAKQLEAEERQRKEEDRLRRERLEREEKARLAEMDALQKRREAELQEKLEREERARQAELMERMDRQERLFREREERLLRAEQEVEQKRREAEDRERNAAALAERAREEAAQRERQAQEAREQARREAEKAKLEAARREQEAARLADEAARKAELAAQKERAAEEAREAARQEVERMRLEQARRDKEVAAAKEAARKEAEAAKLDAMRREREAKAAQQEAARRELELIEKKKRMEEERREQEEQERMRRAAEAKRLKEEMQQQRDQEERERRERERVQREESERRERERVQREERERAEAAERERDERQRRQEAERVKREAEEQRKRAEEAKKEAEREELRLKMERQKAAASDVAPQQKKPAMSPEDQKALEKLTALYKNEFIDRAEFEARVGQILARYPELVARQKEKQKQQQQPAAVVAVQPQQPAAALPKQSVAQAPAMEDCPNCGKSKNASKKFCPHCGQDVKSGSGQQKATAAAVPAATQAAVAAVQPVKAKVVKVGEGPPPPVPKKKAIAIPTSGLSEEDAATCKKLKILLDNGMIEVQDYNTRVQTVLQRAKDEQQPRAKKAGSEQLDEFARALDANTVPKHSVRRTTSEDDDLMQELGLPPPTKTKADTLPKPTVHDEGLDELDGLLEELK